MQLWGTNPALAIGNVPLSTALMVTSGLMSLGRWPAVGFGVGTLVEGRGPQPMLHRYYVTNGVARYRNPAGQRLWPRADLRTSNEAPSRSRPALAQVTADHAPAPLSKFSPPWPANRAERARDRRPGTPADLDVERSDAVRIG